MADEKELQELYSKTEALNNQIKKLSDQIQNPINAFQSLDTMLKSSTTSLSAKFKLLSQAGLGQSFQLLNTSVKSVNQELQTNKNKLVLASAKIAELTSQHQKVESTIRQYEDSIIEDIKAIESGTLEASGRSFIQAKIRRTETLLANSLLQQQQIGKRLNTEMLYEIETRKKVNSAMEDLYEAALEEDKARDIKQQEINAVRSQIGQYNSVYAKFDSLKKSVDLFNDRNLGASGRMLMFSGALMQVGQTLTALRDRIYQLQRELGTTFSSAIRVGAGAIYNQVRSFFSGESVLSFQDTVDTINAFQKEFGGILTTDAARRIAVAAKDLGVSAEDYLRAQRAFLVVGGDVTRTAFITQFRDAGLTAAQALQFAANNANLVAIAGTRYANELARAAANAQRIGVSLDKTEQFADNLVGDFEGGLERFSELRAMGVEVDFNRLAQVSAMGTPEEVFNELSRELGGNKALLENIQKNRFLKVSIEKDLGLSIADVTRLAGGEAAKAPEATEQEKLRDALTKLTERIGPLFTVIGGLASAITTVMGATLSGAVGLNTLATDANTVALGGKSVVEGIKGIFTGGGALATAARVAGGLGAGLGGATVGTAITAATGGNVTNAMIGGGIGTALGTAAIALAPETFGASLLIPLIASGLGSLIGGRVGVGKAVGGLVTGPGTATSDNIMTPTSPGEFVINTKATQTYGTDFLNKVNSATYRPETPAVNNTVNVDMSKLESKLDKLATAVGNVKIQMSGYEVGNVSLNDRSPLFTASPSRVAG